MSQEKPWGGRFAGKTAPAVERFTTSLPFDIRLVRQDVEGSLAHTEILRDAGLLTAQEAAEITDGLRGILADVLADRLSFDPSLEDVHMAVETILTERIGAVGGKLHTARSRNDQVALDLRLWVKETATTLASGIDRIVGVLEARAGNEAETVMPGYTHLQPAQPVSLGHYLLAYREMFARDAARFRAAAGAANLLPTGSGALAGVNYPLDRRRYAELLGLSGVTANSMDAVSDRDFAMEFLFAGLLLMTHASRLAEDLILWSSPRIGFVVLPDEFCTGSSIMPQKKNPDILELTRGKTGRALGNLVTLATVLKGLPMTYNRDLQEDKEPVFDTADTVAGVVEILPPLLAGAEFRREAMAAAAAIGETTATELADYLVVRGIPFREAHRIVGKLVRKAADSGRMLKDLTIEELREADPRFDGEALARLDPAISLTHKDVEGGTAPERLRGRLARLAEGEGQAP
jgi:argininosuccinate lyase